MNIRAEFEKYFPGHSSAEFLIFEAGYELGLILNNPNLKPMQKKYLTRAKIDKSISAVRETISATQAGKLIGCCRQQTYRYYDAGKIDGYRHGDRKGILIYKDSVESFLNNRGAS